MVVVISIIIYFAVISTCHHYLLAVMVMKQLITSFLNVPFSMISDKFLSEEQDAIIHTVYLHFCQAKTTLLLPITIYCLKRSKCISRILSVSDSLIFLPGNAPYFRADVGWSGGAMVLGKLPVPGRPTYLE